ncbi:16S rRNA (cytosine(967)-C(5))-methyltransferase [Lactobacillus taiwanensis]|uniref:16S rRNA (cytosine(967)-C(5))-methyltransferase RsmB n=1 Tax=Lactobacillus taiwanensis TaxID=508451 RepID=UPI000B98442A|nr:16S rRNA (cytosine(967)-C(5))-methyltransferase RsmB [Lactobacillus taiwanensis]MRM98802.1 16S rRNA (cytosine(967)-C(5))-methyltransferase RsmB [Lactobacillus taiwanensis]OYR99117.1 16S rRNA (cytosine(967)-C(5))-methyltransferase [Lactobacillus taiwanensis]OYS02817.1 16S rRNA (cytosine(967)-C(5))-methyltransferase [Lactobacillus taiwanensis]
MSNARTVALDTLIKVFNQKSYSNIALNNELEKHDLKASDKALATRIVYGTIQYKLFLEYQLNPLIKTNLRDKFLKPLLLMSAYQYFFLEKVPTNAIFDEANKLAKKYGKKNSGSYKLVNGILRALERQGKILPAENDLVNYLSIKESFPKWLVEYLLNNFGKNKTKEILIRSNQPASNSIRMTVEENSFEKIKEDLRKDGFDCKESSLTTHNLNLNKGGVAKTDLFETGKITIQDAAASLAVDAFNFKGNEHVLDACSAPGGKTVQIAEKLTTGNVVALDIHENKLKLVKNAAKRLHVSDKVKTKALDARKAKEYFAKEQFDKILVDAPCSGLGLIRRKPEIRYEKSLNDIKNLAKIQLAILENISGLLRTSGELVYSTCTISYEEDEGVIKQFLKLHPDFELVPVQVGKLPKQQMVRIFPSEDGSDGFFIAKLKKRG